MLIDGLPLHPIVVHLPVALAVIGPFAALWTLWAIKTGRWERNVWTAVVVLNGALFLTGLAALKTGEQEEDRVEAVVGDAPIHDHEENAEVFVIIAGLTAALSVAGLFIRDPKLQATAMAGACIAGFAALGSAALTGHSGGQLVYKHNAGSAYSGTSVVQPRMGAGEDEDDDD